MTLKKGFYTPLGAEGFEICHPVNDSDFETIIAKINGIPCGPAWKIISMKLVNADDSEALEFSDSPWLGSHALIFRKGAVDRLGELIQENGELLPLQCEHMDLVIWNPRHRINALDETSSSLSRFSDGRIMMVKRYKFHQTLVKDVDVFKLPNLRVSPTFLSHRFVQAWRDCGLKGLDFEYVWGDLD